MSEDKKYCEKYCIGIAKNLGFKLYGKSSGDWIGYLNHNNPHCDDIYLYKDYFIVMEDTLKITSETLDMITKIQTMYKSFDIITILF